MVGIVKSRVRMLARAGPILRRLPQGGIVVEVGVSTALLGEHLLGERPDIEWFGIDPWLGAQDQIRAYRQSGDVHALLTSVQAEEHMAIARARVRPFGDRAVVLRERSPKAAEWFGDESVDIVFLDGDHSLEGVRADIEGWWPKVKGLGWLGGHDFANPDPRFNFGVAAAVEDWAADAHREFELDDGLCWFVRKPP